MAPVPPILGVSPVLQAMIENLTAAMAAALTAYLDKIQGEVAAFAGRLADPSALAYPVYTHTH